MTKRGVTFNMYGMDGVFTIQELGDHWGESSYEPDKEIPLIITVNNTCSIQNARNTLMHELLETALKLSQCEFECKNKNNYESFFMFDHGKMDLVVSEIIGVYFKILPFMEKELTRG